MRYFLYNLCFLLSITACTNSSSSKKDTNHSNNNNQKLFTKIKKEESNITFKNIIRETLDINFLNYPNLYMGAGVAVGDINNDGLEDVYFISNFGPNKLYKNTGNFEFKDITVFSKTEDYKGFSTGVTMLDINNDGWLDIYVSKAGSMYNENARRNLLFVNQKDGTFKEDAKKWGVDDPGYTTQVYSLDYDKDGDLDLYLVNHRYDFKNNNRISAAIQNNIEEITSDQLYRNEGSHFIKVTGDAGLYNKAWGLAGAVGDFNNDGWDDVYVSNDYLEPDAMYINQKDGTFKNEALKRVNHISFNSMGSDYADLNNDGFPDLLTLDMAPESHERSKENMASMSTSNFMAMVDIGYHHAYMSNMLQVNQSNGKFKETGLLSGLAKTDWSWAPLIADFDNDGHKDVFISNGVVKDYTNQDFRNELREINKKGTAMQLKDVLDMIPAQKLNNYVFKNNGDLTFTKVIKEWGLEDPSFSNGAAYADFDNDGDLDIIVNNVNDNIGLYKNNSINNYIQLKLIGPENNTLGIGTSIYVKTNNETQFQKLYLTRGYESSVSNIINFGLGTQTQINEILIKWPDLKISKLENIKPNQILKIDYKFSKKESINNYTYFTKNKEILASDLNINFKHQENDFNDYALQLLIPQKQSTKGTAISIADVNGDGLEDFFVGNASGAEAALYLQNKNGSFTLKNKSLWKNEAKFEDANSIFFDVDQDGDKDLYVVSAGYDLPKNSSLLQDRLYINNGNGKFSKSTNLLPTMKSSGKSVISGDYDGDGDLDLFIGGNVLPGNYPLPSKSYLLKNENGKFLDVTNSCPNLSNIGMISEAIFTDYDNDNDLDLMIVGEWMKPTIFNNNQGVFNEINMNGLENTEGWWFSINAADYDGDGDTDYVLGNLGKNNKFHPSKEKPLFIYAKDFDNNGSLDVAMSKINHGKLVPVRGKECSSEQNPFLLDKIQTYKEFASFDMNEIYGEENLQDAFQLKSHIFESIYIENLGEGNFSLKHLPNEAQTGPTMSLISGDFNEDNKLDIMGVGAIYDAEVETIRYDSNYGYVLLGDNEGNFVYSKEYEPFIDSDSKDLEKIIINGKNYYLVVSNNDLLSIFNY